MGSSPPEAQPDPARNTSVAPGLPISLDHIAFNSPVQQAPQSPPLPPTTSMSTFTRVEASSNQCAAGQSEHFHLNSGQHEFQHLSDTSRDASRNEHQNQRSSTLSSSSRPLANGETPQQNQQNEHQYPTQNISQHSASPQQQRQRRLHRKQQMQMQTSQNESLVADVSHLSNSLSVPQKEQLTAEPRLDPTSRDGMEQVPGAYPSNAFFTSPLPSLFPTEPIASNAAPSIDHESENQKHILRPFVQDSVQSLTSSKPFTPDPEIAVSSAQGTTSATTSNPALSGSPPNTHVTASPTDLNSASVAARGFGRTASSDLAVRSISADELDSSLKRASVGRDIPSATYETATSVPAASEFSWREIGTDGEANTRSSSRPQGTRNPDETRQNDTALSNAQKELNAPSRASRFFNISSSSPNDTLGQGPNKTRGGLLKRLRNVFRGTAQATRARAAARADAKGTSGIASASLNSNATGVSGDGAGVAPRSRTFGFASSRNLAQDRANLALTDEDNVSRSRRFLPRNKFGIATNNNIAPLNDSSNSASNNLATSAPPTSSFNSSQMSSAASQDITAGQNMNRLDELSASQPLSSAAAGSASDTSRASASTGNIHRALPKARVFSSPPSFSFGFGSRRRLSTNSSKYNQSVTQANTSNGSANLLSEGDTGAINKLNRTFNNRGVGDIGRGSGNLNLMTVGSPADGLVQISPEHNAASFRTTLNAVVSGHASFTTLLDTMFYLEERLPPDTKDVLIKYLSKPERMTDLIDNLTVVVTIVAEDDGVQGPGGERVKYRYSYVSSMLLSNGPIQLRRSLFLSPKLLDRLVGVLGHGTPNDAFVVRSVCKVLLSVLRDSPEDTVRAMVRRENFLGALLSHISVTGCPEVCLSMLSTVRCQAELKFGPPNKPIIGVMADANLLDTLCNKLADAARKNPIDGAASSAIENCSRVIVGIALRALVIPRFEVSEDESDADHMLKFNRDLESLDVFQQPEPILRLLDSGFDALNAHDERGYALSTALTAVRYLMVTAINGQDSSLSTIRMQLLTVNTSAYEAGIRQRIPQLARVLQSARHRSHVWTMWNRIEAPLGVVRLKVLELLVVLLQHGSPETAHCLADAQIPQTLMDLFERLELNSLLQHFVATIVENAFRISSPALRMSFLLDVNLIDVVMHLWQQSTARERSRKSTPVSNFGELSRIAISMRDFLGNTNSSEVQQVVSRLGDERVTEFMGFCNGTVAEHESMNGQLLGGVDRLPHRIDEDGGFGDGAGSIFFRPRSGSATVDA